MRTTLDIDDEVLKAAKELARKRHSTAGKVLSDLARLGLSYRGQPNQGNISEPAPAYGFRPFPSRGSITTDEDVEHIRDTEGI